MGMYSFMKGVVYFKPELMEALLPKLLDTSVRWEDLNLPDTIIKTPQFLKFINLIGRDEFDKDNDYYGSRHNMIPGHLTHNHYWKKQFPNNVLTIVDNNKMTFLVGFKDYASKFIDFIAILPLIAVEWHIQQDLSDLNHYEYYTDEEIYPEFHYP